MEPKAAPNTLREGHIVYASEQFRTRALATQEIALPEAFQRVNELEGDDKLQLIHLAVEHAPEGIAVIKPGAEDAGPSIVYVNEAFCRITGTSREEAVGERLEIFRCPESDRALVESLYHPVCRRRAFEGEATAFKKNGSQYALELLVVPIHDLDGEVVYWLTYLKDVSERKAKLAALQEQALHDVLTRLPNRTLLRDRVEQAILVGKRTGSLVALMIMDLDGFKEVNDTLGHHCGDMLLQQVAMRIRGEVHDSDTVARLGGDEFAFVLPAIADAAGAIRAARRVLRALENPFDLDEQKCNIGASIGIAIFPDHGVDAETLMRRADTAMYHAKRTGRGHTMYAAEIDHASISSLALGAELRHAIDSQQLRVYYQPKVHLRTGLVTRVEALVRWKHPQRGLLLPDQFIPLAERTGLIKPLTDWVLDNALQQCAQWQNDGMPIHIAVNLSTKILQEHFLPQTVQGLLDKWKLQPRSLKLEITESSIMADPGHILAILSLIQDLGVRLSLDDFGTGYSSLMHLRQLPVDEIKIDKSFIMGMATSPSDTAIVRATIELAHNLGRQVVAEGVDDERTCRTLSSFGCDMAQGYYISRPVPAEAFEKWLYDTGWGLTTFRRLRGEDAAQT